MGWGTKQLSYLIGLYDGENKSFSKIWTRNFRKIDNYPNSDLPVCPLPVSFNGLIHNQVYTFNWDFSNSSTKYLRYCCCKEFAVQTYRCKTIDRNSL